MYTLAVGKFLIDVTRFDKTFRMLYISRVDGAYAAFTEPHPHTQIHTFLSVTLYSPAYSKTPR